MNPAVFTNSIIQKESLNMLVTAENSSQNVHTFSFSCTHSLTKKLPKSRDSTKSYKLSVHLYTLISSPGRRP